jgi:putative transposase
LRRAIGEAHRRYTRRINFREGWRGCLWQGRFASFVMDEQYTLAAARYIELNPSRARLLADPTEYPWSSAAAHLAGMDDGLARVQPLLNLVNDWGAFLAGELDDDEWERLRAHERTGRPLGNAPFLQRLEGERGRRLRPRKGGRPKKREN